MSDPKNTPETIEDDDLDEVKGAIFGQVWEDVKSTVQDGVETATDAAEQVAGWGEEQGGNAANAASGGWSSTKVLMGTMAGKTTSKKK